MFGAQMNTGVQIMHVFMKKKVTNDLHCKGFADSELVL